MITLSEAEARDVATLLKRVYTNNPSEQEYIVHLVSKLEGPDAD